MRVTTAKFFYRNQYRRAINLLFTSVVLNLLLLLGVFAVTLTRPDPDYYATNGVAEPQLLAAISGPNSSPEPLLAPDPVEEIELKSLEFA